MQFLPVTTGVTKPARTEIYREFCGYLCAIQVEYFRSCLLLLLQLFHLDAALAPVNYAATSLFVHLDSDERQHRERLCLSHCVQQQFGVKRLCCSEKPPCHCSAMWDKCPCCGFWQRQPLSLRL